MSIQPPNARRNGHDSSQHSTRAAEAQCPYCGQAISRKEFKEIQARMAGEEAVRSARREQQIRDGFAREMAKAEAAKNAAIEKARREAAKIADAKVKAIVANQDATIAARLNAERERAAKNQDEAINAEKLARAAEKLRLESALADVQRRLQAKTAHQIGEPAEVDLFEALVAALPEDRITRIVRGVPGPDVLAEIIHDRAVVGKIALDSKAHARWSNKFTTKLRADQLAEGADFGVLVSTVFPAGMRELHLQDNVIVASPARAVVLVHLLRRQIIENHRLKLSAEARNEKADKLFDFIVSPTCDDLFEKLLRLGRDLVGLDTTEAKTHQATWMKRAALVQGVLAIREQFCGVVTDIVGGGR